MHFLYKNFDLSNEWRRRSTKQWHFCFVRVGLSVVLAPCELIMGGLRFLIATIKIETANKYAPSYIGYLRHLYGQLGHAGKSAGP